MCYRFFQQIKAISMFLDQAIVLPVGEWDSSIRLEPPDKVLLKVLI